MAMIFHVAERHDRLAVDGVERGQPDPIVEGGRIGVAPGLEQDPAVGADGVEPGSC
jgi:hypothetical protein